MKMIRQQAPLVARGASRKPRKLILRHHLSPGDVVMLAYAVKALHEQYPGNFLTAVDTSCNEVFEGSPYITELEASEPGVEVLEMHYPTIHRSNEHPFHFANSFIYHLGNLLRIRLEPTAFHGAIFIREEETRWYSAVYERLGCDVPYWIINAGHNQGARGGFKPNDGHRAQAITKNQGVNLVTGGIYCLLQGGPKAFWGSMKPKIKNFVTHSRGEQG